MLLALIVRLDLMLYLFSITGVSLSPVWSWVSYVWFSVCLVDLIFLVLTFVSFHEVVMNYALVNYLNYELFVLCLF